MATKKSRKIKPKIKKTRWNVNTGEEYTVYGFARNCVYVIPNEIINLFLMYYHNTSKLDDTSLLCRMHQKEFPEIGDYTVVKVKAIFDISLCCSLLEYNGIEGIIMSEMKRRRIRNLSRLVGQMKPVMVLRLNKEKRYVDLSMKRVCEEEKLCFEQRYEKMKIAHNVLYKVAKSTGYRLEQLYNLFGWPLCKTFGTTYNGLKYAVNYPKQFLNEFNVPYVVRDHLFNYIKNDIRPKIAVMSVLFECKCFTKYGIVGIKNSFKEALKVSINDYTIKIKLQSPPRYILTVYTERIRDGTNKIEEIMNLIKSEIKQYGGSCIVKSEIETTYVRCKVDRLYKSMMIGWTLYKKEIELQQCNNYNSSSDSF